MLRDFLHRELQEELKECEEGKTTYKLMKNLYFIINHILEFEGKVLTLLLRCLR